MPGSAGVVTPGMPVTPGRPGVVPGMPIVPGMPTPTLPSKPGVPGLTMPLVPGVPGLVPPVGPAAPVAGVCECFFVNTECLFDSFAAGSYV